jgi:hypothetical protein
MSAPTTSGSQLARWQSALLSGDAYQIATTGRSLAEASTLVDTNFRFTMCDYLWRPQADITGWIMDGTGTDPRNTVPTAKLTIEAKCPFWDNFRQSRTTMVGVIVETAGLRFPFYVKTFTEHYEKGELTGIVELKGIWDILNYLIIWPDFLLPIQVQPISYAVFIWALCTALESMVSECALRIQSGLFDFVNNALSLNPDILGWFGKLVNSFQQVGGGPGALMKMLKTPIYVKRTNPFLDTSPLVAKTVRMESCGTVITDITKAYGVDTRMDLWLPAGLNGTQVDDVQPDQWANLTQPTYVFSTTDRSQITGPTKTVFDSVLRTIVDLEGSVLGNALDPLINPKGTNPALPEGAFQATAVGIDFVAPYAIVIAPEPGEDSAVLSYEISHHTPEGWQHIIGGRSPKWLNDLMNATTAWLVCAPSGQLGGAQANNGNPINRFTLNPGGVHRNTVRFALRFPQQRVLCISAHRALSATSPGRPVPPRRRDIHRDGHRAVQHRDGIRLHQQALGHTGAQHGDREDERVRTRRPICARPRHFQGRPDVSRVRRSAIHAHRLHREHHLAHHTHRA